MYNDDDNVENKKRIWDKLSRFAGIGIALIIGYVSWKFSVNGFNFEVPKMAWVGGVLATCIIGIEIVFNKDNVHANRTLWFAGVAAYAYGMYTNVLGIWAAQGAHAGAKAWVFPVLLGVFIEWIPEPLFVWGLLGVVTAEGDFLGNFVKMFNGERPVPRLSRSTPKANKQETTSFRKPDSMNVSDILKDMGSYRPGSDNKNTFNKDKPLTKK
jgi:hypothetical protein